MVGPNAEQQGWGTGANRWNQRHSCGSSKRPLSYGNRASGCRHTLGAGHPAPAGWADGRYGVPHTDLCTEIS